jgi:hypothetical protein
MNMENRRQFIPRQEGDTQLTQAELDAQSESGGDIAKFFKNAGYAALLGAAAFNAENASAQTSPVEKQKIESVKQEFAEEENCQILLSMMKADSKLAPFFNNARVREADSSVHGGAQEKTYYVYLPSNDVVLTIKFDNYLDHHPSNGKNTFAATPEEVQKSLHEFQLSTLRAMIDNGLIEITNGADGKAEVIPHYKVPQGNKAVKEQAY